MDSHFFQLQRTFPDLNVLDLYCICDNFVLDSCSLGSNAKPISKQYEYILDL